jgi:hypothetical protein
MALSAQHKVDIRRHLKVPFSGIPNSQYVAGLRTILTVGQLEMYMNVLAAEEECTLTGYPCALVRIWGTPAVGNIVRLTINNQLVSYAVHSADVLASQPLLSIANNLAQQVNLSGIAVQAATGSISTADVPPAALPATGQLSIVCPQPFTLSATGTGLAAVVDPVLNGQTFPSPNFAGNYGVTPVYGYINICNYLENRTGQEDAFASFSKTDIMTFRKYPLQQRLDLYNMWVKKMGVALSVGANPAGTEGMGSAFGIIA